MSASNTGPSASRSASTVNLPRPTSDLMSQSRRVLPPGGDESMLDDVRAVTIGFGVGESAFEIISMRHQPRSYQASSSATCPRSCIHAPASTKKCDYGDAMAPWAGGEGGEQGLCW